MVMVRKRDGSQEPFIQEKIVVSAVKAGAPADYAREIARDVERNAGEDMSTGEIRRQVLEKLRSRNPEWERNWQVYDEAVKKRAPPGSQPAVSSAS